MIHPTYTLLLNLFKQSFPQEKKLDILDYGCGNGYCRSFLSENMVKSYIGCDISESAINCAKKTYNRKNTTFFLYNKRKKILIYKKVDVIFIIGVLQYMSKEEIVLLLQKMKSLLKKNGKIFISCATDHAAYRWMNIYGWFLPNEYISREWLIKILGQLKFKQKVVVEKGLFFTPLSSQLSLIFDGMDKILFKTRGRLGLFGNFFRNVSNYINCLEYRLPIDCGYTLYIEMGAS